jgi:hypothetical protein
MSSVGDMFIWNASSSRDYTSTGQSTPSVDATQDWTIVSDNVVSGTRTVVATRALVSSGDYTFTNSATAISIIYAQGNSTTLAQHSGVFGGRSLARTTLGVDDFSLNATQIYPNPSRGSFLVRTNTNLERITIYSQIGTFVKTIEVNDGSNEVELNVNGLSTGIYLLELQNSSQKVWKKVIVE